MCEVEDRLRRGVREPERDDGGEIFAFELAFHGCCGGVTAFKLRAYVSLGL